MIWTIFECKKNQPLPRKIEGVPFVGSEEAAEREVRKKSRRGYFVWKVLTKSEGG